jgi:glycosyltransferase involved in cell wall biosynthesis
MRVAMPSEEERVRFSVVTPSFNQGKFIERTVRSVLQQTGDFDVEYRVVDGGSTDETVPILRTFTDALTWSSEPDRGQSDAINKGFRLATGDVLSWINSDDEYEPGAFAHVAEVLRSGAARWCFGDCRIVDEEGREIRHAISGWKALLSRRYTRGLHLLGNFVPQPAVFFRRDLLEEVGVLDERHHLAMDYDLWLRFSRIGKPAYIPRPLARFRWHGSSKSGSGYRAMAWEAFRIASENARGVEKLMLVPHLGHVAALSAGYGLLDLAERTRRTVSRK